MQDNNNPQPTPEAPAPAPVAPAAPTPATEPTFTPPPVATTPGAPKKGLPKAAKIIIGVVVGFIVLAIIGIIALVLIVNAATKAPLDVSNKFFDDLQANRSSSAYQLTSPEFKETAT